MSRNDGQHPVSGTSPAVGRTLAGTNLRGLTGATVLAILRREGPILAPAASEVLREGDLLALAGSHESVEAAKSLLRGGPLGAATGPTGG